MKTILVDAINPFFIKGEWIYQPLYDLLEQYSNDKVLLTGANDEEIQKYRFIDMPYQVFTLKHNPEKSDPQYYEAMLSTLWLTREGVIYFEHNKNAVTSAESVWILTHYYDKDEKDIDALKEFLDSHL